MSKSQISIRRICLILKLALYKCHIIIILLLSCLDCLLNRLLKRLSKKNQSSASLAFVRGLHRRSVDSSLKGQVTRKIFPFDDVITKNADAYVMGRILIDNNISQSMLNDGLMSDHIGVISASLYLHLFIVRRAGLLWSQQDFEWLWSVPLSSASLY